jgi:hypothetical protein
VSRDRLLNYRAGDTAIRLLRAHSFTPGTFGALAGPASGPKWIVLSGLDRALLESSLLSTRTNSAPQAGRPLLVGASAGAWRMFALASRNPQRAHRRLLDGYINQTFPPDFTASFVSDAYRRILSDIIEEQIDHLLDHPRFDIAAHVVRVRRPLGWTTRFAKQAQMLSLGLTALLQAISSKGTDLVLERGLFHTRPEKFDDGRFVGRIVRLTQSNMLDAAMASGTVPLYMVPVRDPHGAPSGLYLDGGLSDYHLRQQYATNGSRPGITLFPHFQRRIVPIWFDRYWARRAPSQKVLDNVLQVYPSDAFIARLPGGRIPERQDFFTFSDRPQERIRRWNEAAKLSDELGQAFLDDLEHGRIPDLVEPF